MADLSIDPSSHSEERGGRRKRRRKRRRKKKTGAAGASPPRWRKWARRLFRVGLVLSLIAALGLSGSYVYYVVLHPGPHLERSHILSVISQESPVLYRDGVTPLGVFFAEDHRQYVGYDDIPRDFIDALVAAEDQSYWSHGGFSLRGIARAFVSNLKAGRVVEGGSTLTQQTAKNLFKRRGRTYREKLRELANALRLERLYSKEDILEFYSNQFYVNGNGRGLSIAARFFFDKELGELELVECAFLAGVVKSPNRYNPWVPGLDRQQKARAEARGRTDYVLGRMRDDGHLDEERYQQALRAELSFERGHFRFARSVALDDVERELTRPTFQLLLARHGIGDLGTSGLRITTTLDATIQRGARYALRHHLTRVGILLEEPDLSALFGEAKELKPVDPDQLRRGYFHSGVLVSADPESRTARVDLGGVEGLVDVAGNERLAEIFKRSRNKNNWARATRKQTAALVEELRAHIGHEVTVSIRELSKSGEPLLDFEFEPKVQGGVVVLEDGAVRAMVGGARDTDYNRATVARRQFGSVWKPLLYQAALQLRWQTTDALDNRRTVFPYQGGYYYPRPAHADAPPSVSMAWAAAKSENVASIWLLHHLTDRLSPEEFLEIAARVDLVARPGERPREFRNRIHEAGLVPTQGKLSEGLFHAAREDRAIDLAFDGLNEELVALEGLGYGLGFAEQLEKLSGRRRMRQKEKTVRAVALRRSFLRQEALATRFTEARSTLMERRAAGEAIRAEDLVGFSIRRGEGPKSTISFGDHLPEGFEVLTPELLEGLLPARVLPPTTPTEDSEEPASDAPETAPGAEPEAEAGSGDPVRAKPPGDLKEAVKPRGPLSPRRRAGGEAAGEVAAPRQPPKAPPTLRFRVRALASLLGPDKVVLEGQLRPVTVEWLRKAIEERRAVLGAEPGLYEPDQLALIRDYRALVGIRYVIELARRSGVRSPIEPVQSMPLGSSDITLLEAAQLYQVMLTGSTYRFEEGLEGVFASGQDAEVDMAALEAPYDARRSGEFPDSQIIERIERADGELIYQAERETLPVQEAGTSGDMGVMLRQVMLHGTAAAAEGKVRPVSTDAGRAEDLRSLDARVPLAGKTGTTNSYKNAGFVGMVPGLPASGDDLTWGRGHVIATYVGYDDNTEMKRGGIRIAGASGSLPVWTDVARACVEASETGDRVDLLGLSRSDSKILQLDFPEGFQEVAVDKATGLPLPPGSEGGVVLLRSGGEGRFEPFAELPSLGQP